MDVGKVCRRRQDRPDECSEKKDEVKKLLSYKIFQDKSHLTKHLFQPPLQTGGAQESSAVVDGGEDIKIRSSADAGDYCTIATGANGATTITTVDEGYYTYPPTYQQWNITSSTPTGYTGKWNVNVDLSACGTTTWPQGSYGGAPPATPPSYNGRSWTKVGHQGCCGWDFSIVEHSGSYTTVTPDPVWNDNDVDYPVWDFFA